MHEWGTNERIRAPDPDSPPPAQPESPAQKVRLMTNSPDETGRDAPASASASRSDEPTMML